MIRHVAVNVALLILSAIIVLACAELFLRTTSYGELNDIVVFDDFTGYRLKPGKHITYKTADYAFDININSQGIRDVEHEYKRNFDRTRILFVGDSQTFGHGVQLNQAFAKLVENITGFETINAGCPGWGPDQSLIFLKQYGMRYHPDIVVLGLYIGNDLQDLAGSLNQKFVVSDTRTLFKLLKEIILGQRQDSICRVVKSFLRFRFRVFSFFIDKSKVVYREFRRKFFKKTDVLQHMPEFLKLLYVKRQYYSDDIRIEYDKMFGILNEFERYCKSNGIDFYVAIIPQRAQVSNKDWLDVLKVYNLSPELFDRRLPNSRIIEYCRSRGIKVSDASDAFAKYCESAKGQLYFSCDDHLNKKGHEITADTITNNIKGEQPWK